MGSRILDPEELKEVSEWCEAHREEIERTYETIVLSREAQDLYFKRYIFRERLGGIPGVEGGNGYVYIWKHNGGSPFYVGSGVRERAASVGGRSEGFITELSAADCVVWYIAEGMPRKLAFEVEQYCSVFLSAMGFKLCNRDFNVDYMSPGNRERKLNNLSKHWFAGIIGERLSKMLAATEVEPGHAQKVKDVFLTKYGRFFFQEEEFT